MRILVIGASGSGSSTLARALAGALETQHFEVDDFFWKPTDPPFRERRPAEERVRLLREMVLPRGDWVLAGSPMGWGDAAVIPRLSHVIFTTLDPQVRLARLSRRERVRYGPRIDPGGERYESYRAFMDWAAGYDRADFLGRSRLAHDSWLDDLPCPVLRLDARASRDRLVQVALDWLASGLPAPRAQQAIARS
ncbi:adenylate kinase [Frigidibacter sp. MR17.24]|uniref:adenylate kinase n=1 Tax=Frigidibacter sp. MR17.24 TaxID=3127345 RepID=UPI003012B07F